MRGLSRSAVSVRLAIQSMGLDVADRAARKASYKIGRSHAAVKAHAKSAIGRVLGRPSVAA